MLQEGIWLSSSPRLHEIGAGQDVILPKAKQSWWSCFYHNYSGAGLVIDNLDQRASVCYLPCGL